MSSKKFIPPRWVDALLSKLLDIRLYEGVMGDLDEKYKKRVEEGGGRWKANLLYVLEGLGFVRMTRWSKFFRIQNPTAMYKNYFTVAFRNISRDRLYVFLNISGLAIGIACLMVIYVYISFETSYDKFHTNAERIYRIPEEYVDDAQLVKSAMNHAPLATIISENLTGVKNVVRIFPYSTNFNAFISSTPDKLFKEESFCFADSNFFRVFNFTSLTGSLDHVLDAPYAVVLTREMATKYFGSVEEAIGKPLTFQNDERSFPYHVSAVIEDIPQNSHFSFDFMASFSSLDYFMKWYNNWHFPPMYVYVEMMKMTDKVALEKNIQEVVTKHQPDYVKEEKRVYHIQPLTDIHLQSHLDYEWEANSDEAYLRIYVLTGIFILLIACINFMNMSTARSARRAREVGMRKTLGGNRSQLVMQFLTESLIYCVLAFMVAVGIAELSLNYFFNDIIQKKLSLFDYVNENTLLFSVGFIGVLALLSGLYPSFYLSAFRPVQVLKGKSGGKGGSVLLRKSLVTLQFFISCLLISATFIVLQQVDFMRDKNLGFNKDHIVTLKLSDRYAQKNYETLKNDLLGQSQVTAVALSSTLPGSGNFYGFNVLLKDAGDGQEASIKTIGVDEDFISTYDLQLLEGRNFSKDIPTDQTEAFIINEAAAKKFGWNESVGKELVLTVYIDGEVKYDGKVIGVVSDFNFQSLHSKVEPLLLYINKHPYYADYLSVKFSTDNLESSIALLKEKWNGFNPEKPIDFKFLDEQLNQLYTTEIKISKIFNVLAGISICISCLGLFGLSAFVAEKRTKEVGIRKVMGATLPQVIKLLLNEFVILVLLANVFVWPFAWWWASGWLSGFAYHIGIDPMIFVFTFGCALLLVVLTLLYHSVKVARVSPVDSLRHE